VELTTIHAFIQRPVSDPDLSPETIAAAHHISLRLLHKLFSEEGETVAGWIRTRRLEGVPPGRRFGDHRCRQRGLRGARRRRFGARER
jgi:hypothetical protein